MPRAQRKEEILRSELPPTLPLMALRSTIVYPLGTIAVQMGAPENLSIIRVNEEPGLIVGLFVAGGDHEENVEPDAFVGRVGVAARVHERINLPGSFGDANWAYRISAPVEELEGREDVREATARLRTVTQAAGRLPGA